MARKKAKKKARKKQRKAPVGTISGKCMEHGWKTPPKILIPSRVFYKGRIPFDGATTKDNPTKARKFVTAEDHDGLGSLGMKWPKRVWINPPFGWLMPIFLGKIGWEALMDVEIIAVLPASRSEQRYHQMAVYNAGRGVLSCTIRKRVNFIRPDTGDAPNGNTYATKILGWNVRDEDQFVKAFSPLGACYRLDGLAPTPPE